MHDACVSAGIQGSSQGQKMLSQAHRPLTVRTKCKLAGTNKNPGAIWEAIATSETMYGRTSHTEGG